MVCKNCGNTLPEDSQFCQACGQPVESQEPTEKWQEFKNILSSSKEKIVAVLGAATGKQLLSTGEAKGGCAILSDKRLYIKGTCFRKKRNLLIPKKEETILDVKDITGTGHFKQDVSWMKIVGIICIAIALISCIIFKAAIDTKAETDDKTAMAMLLIGGYGGLAAAIILLLLYKRCHVDIFRIVCAGDVIGLNATYIPRNEWEFFQNCIRQQKDSLEETDKRDPKPAEKNDLPEQLQKYKALLDNGSITQEEYDVLKKKLLNF